MTNNKNTFYQCWRFFPVLPLSQLIFNYLVDLFIFRPHLPHHLLFLLILHICHIIGCTGTQRWTVSTGHRRWSTMTQRSYSLHSLHCNALQHIEEELSRMVIVTLHLSHLPCHTYICFTHQQCMVLRKWWSTKVIVEFSCSRPKGLRPRSNCRPCLNISAHVTTCAIANQQLSQHLHL